MYPWLQVRTYAEGHSVTPSKLKLLADNNFKYNKNGRKVSKQAENTVGKG